VSRLVIMGSGETAPTMVKSHRRILAATAPPAAMLDTTFGFPANADELVERTRAYFAESVGTTVEVARWRRADDPVLAREQALALIGRAGWVFAGPGSPSYALRQWQGTPLPAALADVPLRGGCLVVGSAAACTVGLATIPVYEIYKVGADPQWLTGLDLLGSLAGLRAAVVPHYDNAEGGRYDTRFCYLGEARLAALEQQLDGDTGVLGVDEHTGVEFDLTARVATVFGTGGLTARYRGSSVVYPSGAAVALAELAAALHGESARPPAPAGPPGGAAAAAAPAPSSADGASLAAATEAARAGFDAAFERRDVAGCVAAVLALDAAITAWQFDTLQSADGDRARQAVRSMVVRLGELAERGARDPREVLGPLVESLLELRGRARHSRDFATADLVRDRLTAAGVEVRDTAAGVEWHVAG
jgi:hypothetical protein